jgi:hypothetical protein
VQTNVQDQILQTLRRREPRAAFVAEVASSLKVSPGSIEVEEALRTLDRQGRVLVADHAAPDVHLESADLRIVAFVPESDGEQAATRAAEALWESWLRVFLATHRCQ